MKKILLMIFILVIALPLSAAVDDTHTITLETEIPEDWAIEFPNALHLDKLFFAEINVGDDYTLLVHSDLDFGISRGGRETRRLVILFYGNPAQTYDVELASRSDAGFVHEEMKDEGYQFPLNIEFQVPEFIPDGVGIEISEDKTRAFLTVDPNGPISGLRVLDMVFSWDGENILVPGVYNADVELLLETR